MNKDNLPYVFSVVFYVEFGGRPQLNAFWILPIFSHFQASLATQTLKNKSQIVFDGQCQKWSRLLASNDLKWRREFSNEDLRPKTPWTKTKTALTKTKTPWTKTTDANRCGQCPLSWFVTAIWECCGISSAVFTCDNQVYHLPFLQVSWEIGSSSVSCGYNAPSVKKIGVTSPKVISVAMGGLTIKKAHDRICLEDFRKTWFGRVVGVWGRRGSIGFLIFYGSKFNVGWFGCHPSLPSRRF